MKRTRINKEDVYQQFGWRYEDGDYDPNKIYSDKHQKDKHQKDKHQKDKHEIKVLEKINTFINKLIKNLRD